MHALTTRRPIVTGIALIVLPLVAFALKFVSFGWGMVLLVFSGLIVVMVLGYALQIVIAVQGFLSRRALFAEGPKRGFIAAWLSLVGALMVGLFMSDGGDTGYGSTLQVWLGSYGDQADAIHAATDGLTDALMLIGAALWVAGFVWLVVEWILALVRRKRLARG